jgi:hypothetical protein
MFVVVFTPKRFQVCCRMLAGFERRSQRDSASGFISRAIRSETMKENQRTKNAPTEYLEHRLWHGANGIV